MTSPRRVIISIQDVDGTVYEGPGPKSDPWHGFASGKSESGSYSVKCTGIKKTKDYGETGYCRVNMQIQRAGDSSVSWNAKFLMHPTFREEELILKAVPEGDVATEYFWSYGPFVVAVVVLENGKETARLELDLMLYRENHRVNGAPADWWTR